MLSFKLFLSVLFDIPFIGLSYTEQKHMLINPQLLINKTKLFLYLKNCFINHYQRSTNLSRHIGDRRTIQPRPSIPSNGRKDLRTNRFRRFRCRSNCRCHLRSTRSGRIWTRVQTGSWSFIVQPGFLICSLPLVNF